MTGLIALSDLRATQQISCKGCGKHWGSKNCKLMSWGWAQQSLLCWQPGALCPVPKHGLEPAVSCSLLASNFAFHCSLPAEEVLVSCSSCPASNIVTFLCTKAVSLLQNWSDFFFLKITNPFDIFLSWFAYFFVFHSFIWEF